MALPRDYIGQSFGPFIVVDHLGGGMEAESFAVLNRATQRRLALRLPVGDDTLWDGAPKATPGNWSIEQANVQGTFKGARSHMLPSWQKVAPKKAGGLIRRGLGALFGVEGDGPRIEIVDLFGVLPDGRLESLCMPIRTPGGVSLQALTEHAPQLVPDGVYTTVLRALSQKAPSILKDQSGWKALLPIVGDRRAHESLLAQFANQSGKRIPSSTSSRSSRRRAPGPSSRSSERLQELVAATVDLRQAPCLMGNPILSLANEVELGRIDVETAGRSLRDPALREGITVFDLEQFAAVLNLLQASREFASTVRLLTSLATQLCEQPWDIWDDPQEFEVSEIDGVETEYELVVQQLARGRPLSNPDEPAPHEDAQEDRFIAMTKRASDWSLTVPHATAFDHYQVGLRLSADYGLSRLDAGSVEYERIALQQRNAPSETNALAKRPPDLFSEREICKRGEHTFNMMFGLTRSTETMLVYLPPSE